MSKIKWTVCYRSECGHLEVNPVDDWVRTRGGGSRKTTTYEVRLDGHEIMCLDTVKDAKEFGESVMKARDEERRTRDE